MALIYLLKKLDNQKLKLEIWEGAAYRVKAFIIYQKSKIRLNLTSLEQYHNFCIKKLFVRKKDALQNVHKGHDWVQKIMYATSR